MAFTMKHVAAFLAVLAVASASSCSSPKVTSTTSFTTQDATVITNIAYVVKFSATCGQASFSNLYADIDGVVLPVSVIGKDNYQVSWTEEIKTAKSGERVVRLFDEDGYTALRKAVRAGESTAAISELFTVSLNHPGAFNGPWLKSEFLALSLSFVVAYLAISSRSKLLV